MKHKAQISGLDLILALMLFFIVMVLFAILWDLVHYNIRTTADADIVAIQVANKLLNSPGYPYDWNATNVQLIGLSSERGVMDQAKLENFLELLELDYNKVRELLGLGPYQIYISLTYTDGSPVIIDGKPAEGGIPPEDATAVSSIRRTAIYGEIVVHNNSITLVFDSSGSMQWFSNSLGYTNGLLTSSWVNIYNITFPSSPTSSFDFVLEFNNTAGSYGRINVTSPSGIKYGCPDGNPGCTNCGTGCTATHYSGTDYMNFTSARWEAGQWKVYARRINYAHPLSFDLLVQTPPRRIDAAKNATKNFIDVIANESKGIDEVSLFRFNGCSPLRAQDFTTNYAAVKATVDAIPASGATPIGQSIIAAADYTNTSATRKHTLMIVISDGSETCGGNVVAAATYAANKVGKICTVGFAQGSTGEEQLKQAAAIGRCQFYSAKNQAELEIALKQIYFGNLEKQKVLLNVVVWR